MARALTPMDTREAVETMETSIRWSGRGADERPYG
ncbi:hypothetical protein ACTODO_00237 [Schaalia dentiphila ATCC 17982]|uniref:Uncharacterized protein n=1 Tax=Schaalia dentiphila ATCC 17982 TaxID=411466 RepID=A7B9D6_9ACTO|nr:hypothetical protein ACTODO_00237 [Schaalia odontolytica ATCC 17982]